MGMTSKQKLAKMLMDDIQKACIKRGLNLTIYDGKIGFVDQKEKKIVMFWNPEHHIE